MFIFLIISVTLIFLAHKTVMNAVEKYNYGHSVCEEWREFERQFQYEDAFKF
jgi:hypothetical protein